MAVDFCTACQALATQCDCTRKEAAFVASGRGNNQTDITSMLFAIADLEAVIDQAKTATAERCKVVGK